MFKIGIIKNTNCNEYYELEKLIKEFAVNVFLVQNNNLNGKTRVEKETIIKNYDKYLSKEELKELNEDISSRISLAKKLINDSVKDKTTRFYIVKVEQEVIGFQTA